MIKLLGICGSPRNAATEYILKEALTAAETLGGVETEFLTVRGKKINFCIACDKCVKAEASTCVLYQDDMTEMYKPFYEADAYLIASPVYDMGVTGQLATFFNRFRPTYTILKKDPGFFSHKVGGAIAVGGTRNGGQEMTINNILNFYQTNGMISVSGAMGVYAGAAVWSKDRKAEGAKEDTIGLKNARLIAVRVAETAKLVKAGHEINGSKVG